MGAFFSQSYTLLKGNNSNIFKNKGNSFWNFTPTVENFVRAYQSSKCVIDLARKGGRSERDKLDRPWPTELTIPPRSDARPL